MPVIERLGQPPIQVDAQAGYEFIYGSMDRHEFRFPQILDWIRLHIKPLP
jgi:hypothetical protein